jgi:hypothetical protein
MPKVRRVTMSNAVIRWGRARPKILLYYSSIRSFYGTPSSFDHAHLSLTSVKEGDSCRPHH